MINVEEALKIVQKHVKPLQNYESIQVKDALGHVLALDMLSPIDMPPFRQSAMDGYALCLNGTTDYLIIDEVKAGDDHHPVLNPGEAVRIFTGAPVPDTANAIVIQEHTQVKGDRLHIEIAAKEGDNIRPLGEQVLKDQLALKKGTKLSPAAIAFITSLGITELTVFQKPSIAIVVTGNELAEAGKNLAYGQIYESNALMLKSALVDSGYSKVTVYKVGDHYDNTFAMLNDQVSRLDMVLISGGISVGDYDFVEKALVQSGVEQLFYKVRQKPGKPLFFGKKDDTFVFALPGNPAAALTCFYIYVLKVLEQMSGLKHYELPRLKARSLTPFSKKGDRVQFLKAFYSDTGVEILEGQNSSMLHTFSVANALVFIPESTETIDINDKVEVILLPVN
jgi:molybdopterin molybdotransferase